MEDGGYAHGRRWGESLAAAGPSLTLIQGTAGISACRTEQKGGQTLAEVLVWLVFCDTA